MNTKLASSLHIDSGRGFRSAQRQVLYLVQGLQRRGHRVLLCCPKAGHLFRHATSLGIPTHPLTIRSGLDFPSTVRLARLFGEAQVSLVHTHDAASQSIARAAQGMSPDQAPQLGMVSSRHDLESEESLNQLQSAAPAVRWLAAAPRIRRHLEKLGVPSQQIDLVPHGVDLAEFADLQEEAADPWGLRQQPVSVIGTVSHLTRQKNVSMLLQAFSRLLETLPAAHLLVVGEGPQLRTLHKLCDTLGIAGKVTFAGAVESLRSIYASMDVYALASDGEISGHVLLDAMGAGVPIACTASAGILSVARHGTSALVVPPRDPQALADSMARLLQQADLARQVVGGAMEIAREYSVDRMVDRTLESYQKLAASPLNRSSAE